MPLARKVLTEVLRGSAVVQVVAAVSGARAAVRAFPAARPDVILLDVQPAAAPEMERLRALRPDRPLPAVLFTALEGGEQEAVASALGVLPAHVLTKPPTNLAEATAALRPDLETALRKAHHADLLRARPGAPLEEASFSSSRARAPAPTGSELPGARVIAIGASTGGTEAIARVLAKLPAEVPGVVIVQHMPAGFTRPFAQRLNDLGALEVREAADGDEVRPGRALVAPGGCQMTVARAGGGYVVRVAPGPKVNGHCPSVDVLMRSAARHAGPWAVGVLLTGMGGDGAEGMKAIRAAGGGTVAQDEATSVVYGMPREAVRRGGTESVAPLDDIARHILLLAARDRG
jgi:two-component system chemotaxis response regulator CheB